MISEYVERLGRELDFDPPLARRVRREIEDHLREAVAADPEGGPDAERRALANFGDPREIAAQFAVVSLGKQARRAGVAAVLIIAAVFAAMKARLAWYGLMQCPPLADELQALGQVVASIDRYAFWLAGLIGIAGWIYIERRRVPAVLTGEYRKQLRRFSLLCFAATAALLVSVASDGALTSLRIIGSQWSAEYWLPVLSMAVEIACAGLLLRNLRDLVRIPLHA